MSSTPLGHAGDACRVPAAQLNPNVTFAVGKLFALSGRAVNTHAPAEHDVVSIDEIARAAAVHPDEVREALRMQPVTVLPGGLVTFADGVRLGRLARGTLAHRLADPPLPLDSTDHAAADAPGTPRRRAGRIERRTGMPAAVSAAVHGGVIGVLALLASAGVGSAPAAVPVVQEAARLVFLATPGPGGGGGGGGLRQPKPATRARREGRASLSSPVPPTRPAPMTTPKAVPDPAPPPAEAKVVAPVAPSASDTQERPGVVEAAPAPDPPSQGPGSGGGAGTGTGSGLGEGTGPGIGEGEGGGMGGGPYRPGSGITPPRLLREVKPDYTDEARRRGLSGEVVLEIVVQRNGSVGDVRVLQGLGGGLDARAVAAVRQWRFEPATRRGTPVDVMVEVAVEFRLR